MMKLINRFNLFLLCIYYWILIRYIKIKINNIKYEIKDIQTENDKMRKRLNDKPSPQ